MNLPTYGGRLDELFQLYKEQVEQYFIARGVDCEIQELSQRNLDALGETLKQGLSQGYVIQKQYVTDVEDFFRSFERE